MAGNAIPGSILRIAFYYFTLKEKNYIVLNHESFTEEIVKLAENTFKMYYSENIFYILASEEFTVI